MRFPRLANPFLEQISSGALSASAVARSQLLLPYPDYLGVGTYAARGTSSIYHSLQVTVERRFSRGLSTLVSYTNSKVINDSFSSAGGGGAPGEFRVGRLNRPAAGSSTPLRPSRAESPWLSAAPTTPRASTFRM